MNDKQTPEEIIKDLKTDNSLLKSMMRYLEVQLNNARREIGELEMKLGESRDSTSRQVEMTYDMYKQARKAGNYGLVVPYWMKKHYEEEAEIEAEIRSWQDR